MRLVVIEGTEATGTTTQTDAAADALRAHGVDARAWHHKREVSPAPWAQALGYAQQRAALCAAQPATVMVVDRWWHTARVEALCNADAWIRTPTIALAASEHDALSALSQIALTVVLDASDAVLDARMSARGEIVTPRDHARRRHYRSATRRGAFGDVLALDTGALSVEATTAAIVARALEVLR